MPTLRIYMRGTKLGVKPVHQAIAFLKIMCVTKMYTLTADSYGDSLDWEGDEFGTPLKVRADRNSKGYKLWIGHETCYSPITFPNLKECELKSELENHLWAVSVFEAIQENFLPDARIIDYLHYHTKSHLNRDDMGELRNTEPNKEIGFTKNALQEHLRSKHHDLKGVCKRIDLNPDIMYGNPTCLSQDKAGRLTVLNKRMGNTKANDNQPKCLYLESVEKTIRMALDYI